MEDIYKKVAEETGHGVTKVRYVIANLGRSIKEEMVHPTTWGIQIRGFARFGVFPYRIQKTIERIIRMLRSDTIDEDQKKDLYEELTYLWALRKAVQKYEQKKGVKWSRK